MAATGVIARGVLSFGLVSISVDIHSVIEDHGVHTHLLHKKCASRVRNQMICRVCKVVVERDDLVRGFELSKGNYVQITEEELEGLEPKRITESNFVSLSQPKRSIRFTSRAAIISHLRRRGKALPADGGDAEKTARVAIAQTVFHEKESLVAVRLSKAGS